MTAIHIRTPALTIRAGTRAMRRLRDNPLSAADVHVIPGAAGGPKALGLSGLDKTLFGHWLPGAPQPRALVGSSIGSWRFAAVASSDNPVTQLELLAELYTQQRFTKGASAADVTRRSLEFLQQLLGGREQHILNHPQYRLSVMVVRSLGLLQHDSRGRLALGLLHAIGSNMLGRRYLGRVMERGIVQDSRTPAPLEELRDFASHTIALSQENLLPALLASASIPMVMSGVANIPGAPVGLYRDGGLLDYHLDLPYQQPGVVLYPHFTDRIIPGWFDKSLPWRKSNVSHVQDVLLVAPSASYLASLPNGKLPDRRDFEKYWGDDAGREKVWRRAIAESERLGDEFMELVEKRQWDSVMQPL